MPPSPIFCKLFKFNQLFLFLFALFSIPSLSLLFCHYWMLSWLFFVALDRTIIDYTKLVVVFPCALSCTFLHCSSSAFLNCRCVMKCLPSSSQPGLILMLPNGLVLANFISSLFSCCYRLFWICWTGSVPVQIQVGSVCLVLFLFLNSFLCMQRLSYFKTAWLP